MVKIKTTSHHFQAGDRVSPTWQAGSTREGVVLSTRIIRPRNPNKPPRQMVTVFWDKGPQETLGKGTVHGDMLRLVSHTPINP